MRVERIFFYKKELVAYGCLEIRTCFKK